MPHKDTDTGADTDTVADTSRYRYRYNTDTDTILQYLSEAARGEDNPLRGPPRGRLFCGFSFSCFCSYKIRTGPVYL